MTATTVAVLDYGSGNLRSVVRSLEHAGAQVQLTADPDLVEAADGLLVPGVGAFEACMQGLHAIDGAQLITRRWQQGRPMLGVCVGMQILFAVGIEHGQRSTGVGVWPETVERLQADVVPHMGWNTVQSRPDSVMFAGLEEAYFYFVHSYAVRLWTNTERSPGDGGVAEPSWSEHGGDRFVSAVEAGGVWATQFHPEKSSAAGQRLLRNWLGTIESRRDS